MNFIKKHEFLFAAIMILTFIAPLLLQFFGVIKIFNFQTDFLTFPFMVILAFIPAYVWIRIFNAENPEAKSTLMFAFVAGCTSTIPVFLYQKLFINSTSGNFIFFKAEAVNFQENIANIFGYPSLSILTDGLNDGVFLAALGVFLVFMGVGALEEVVKHVVINKRSIPYLAVLTIIIGLLVFSHDMSVRSLLMSLGFGVVYLVFLHFLMKNIVLKSIDDAIEVSIIAALGFAFIENIHYFSGKFGTISTSTFIFFVFVRVTVVTVVHVLCSGIMGYHAGLAHFAGPVFQNDIREGRKMFVTEKLHEFFQTPRESVFRIEQIIIGLFYAIMIHAFYDFIMQLKYSILGIPMYALIMPLYFFGGLWYLFTLLENKEDHKKYGRLVVKEEFVD